MINNIFEVLYLIGILIGSIIRKRYMRGMTQKEIIDAIKGADGLLLILVSFGMFILPITYIFTQILDFADYYLPMWAGWFGALIFGIAIWLLWRSHKDLGENFSLTAETREGQILVTKGVYKKYDIPCTQLT